MGYELWKKDFEMRPVKMAVIDVGRRCNVKCSQCYYKYEEGHEKFFEKTLQQLNEEAFAAKQRGCDRIDYTGGEPTVHPYLVNHIKYVVNELKIIPRVITNCQRPFRVKELIDAGCKDFLLSLHEIDECLDSVMGVKNTWQKALETIKVIKENGAQFAANTVIMKPNFNRLHLIAEEVIKYGPYLYNFINCNPQYSADKDQIFEIQAFVSQSAPYLQQAIDIIGEKNIWANVRYFPMCVLEEKYRKHIVNHPQVMFDWRNEWDYGVYPKTVQNYYKYGHDAFQISSNSQEGKCAECNKLNVCGGLNRGYKLAHGEDEIVPQSDISDYSFYYRSDMEAVDIVIPAYKIEKNLSLLLEEIQQKTAPPYNIILLHREQSAAKNRNDGLNRCESPFIIMLDDDVRDLPYLWNKRLIDRLLYNPNIMAASARLMSEDSRIGLNSANNYNLSTEYEKVNMIPTACCVFRKADVDRVNLKFDERFLGSGWEDTCFFFELKDGCKKVGIGTDIIIDNTVKVVHLNNETNNNKWFEYNKQVFLSKMDEKGINIKNN